MRVTFMGRHIYPLKNSDYRSDALGILDDKLRIFRMLKYIIDPDLIKFRKASCKIFPLNFYVVNSSNIISCFYPGRIVTGINYTTGSTILALQQNRDWASTNIHDTLIFYVVTRPVP